MLSVSAHVASSASNSSSRYIAPLIRQFDIAGRVEEERHLDIPHCFLVLICGLSGAVPKRVVYAYIVTVMYLTEWLADFNTL